MPTKVPYKFIITQKVNDKRTENSHSCYLQIERKYIKLLNITEMETGESRELKIRFDSKIFKNNLEICYNRFTFQKNDKVEVLNEITKHKSISAECHYWGKNKKGQDNRNFPQVLTKYRLDDAIQKHNAYLPKVLGYGEDEVVPVYKILVNIKNIIRKKGLFKDVTDPVINFFTNQTSDLNSDIVAFSLYKSSNFLTKNNFNSACNHIIYFDNSFDCTFQLGIEANYSKFADQFKDDSWLLEQLENNYIVSEFYGQEIQDTEFENGKEIYREVVII